MPDSIAGSITFALASASMRQAKLLQPSPTTETSSEPILRVCIGPKCDSDAAAQASRSGDFQVAEGPGSARVSRVGDDVSSSRTFLQRLFRRDAETNTRDACATRRKLRGGSPRSPDETNLQREHNHARNPFAQTQAERHQPHRFVVH